MEIQVREIAGIARIPAEAQRIPLKDFLTGLHDNTVLFEMAVTGGGAVNMEYFHQVLIARYQLLSIRMAVANLGHHACPGSDDDRTNRHRKIITVFVRSLMSTTRIVIALIDDIGITGRVG